MKQSELAQTLRSLLRQATQQRFEGGAYAKFARLNGYADGYMQALVDCELFDQETLLRMVTEERRSMLAGQSAADRSFQMLEAV